MVLVVTILLDLKKGSTPLYVKMPPNCEQRSTSRPRNDLRLPRVVLLIESSRFSGRSLLRGIANYARHHGPWAFYWEPGGLEKAWPQLKNLEADGIILRDIEKVESILAYKLPTVVVGHSQSEIHGLANVVTDSEAIGAMAAEHLISRGFRQFAFCGLEGFPWSTLRGESFSRYLAARGFATHFYHRPIGVDLPIRQGERNHMAQWLKSLPKPVGLMACNDDRGEEVIEACKMAALQVPDEVAIIGADNDDLVCDLSDPPLSSIAINFERAGYESAQVLDQLMQGHKVKEKNIIVPATHVVTRRSTDLVAVDNPQLATALRFIRDHAREIISVPDVARAAGLSRRVLEKRFRKLLRRSALSEIRRVHVDQICRMLVETNQSIAQIAQALGYNGTEHVARYFRREKQMTPLAYRAKYGRK